MNLFIKSVLIITLFLVTVPVSNALSVTANPTNPHQTEKLSTTPIKYLNKTLVINGNNQLGTYANKGDGSRANPFLLENYYIAINETSQIDIELKNINEYFILKNITFQTNYWLSHAGLQMVNVSHGTIINNEYYDFKIGIELYNSTSNSFVNNQMFGVIYGITLNASTNNIIDNNLFNHANGEYSTGISVYKSNFNTIQNNRIEHFNTGFDIFLSNNSLFKNNLAENESEVGFVISSLTNDIFVNSTSSFNEFSGFQIYKCINTTFSKNKATENGIDGFILTNSSQITFTNNIAIKNSFDFEMFYNHNVTLKNNKFGKTNLPKNFLIENLPVILTLFIFSTIIIAVVVHKRRKQTNQQYINFTEPRTTLTRTNIHAEKDPNKNLIHYCFNCHKPYSTNTTFCENCGYKLKKVQS